jgi:hypothetical protein
MSNNSIRIRTTPNGEDKYLKVKLDQEFDFIEILSLKITQDQAYRNFCSDYGVVVGRVIINSGFGVENARVSIFIPIDDVDKDNPIINGLYPYEVVTDKDIDGKRYNVLPKYSETDNECFTPVGTFPNKREVLDDPEMLEVYCKYYKFTTTTNNAGDFMIFGVPLGTYTLHVDADISDIGIASQRPYDSISQGSPLEMFDSPTKFKGGTNLDKLFQIKTVNSGVNVQPFWGDVNNCEIGISRVDVDLNYTIRPCAIFMGGIFGDQDKNSVNKNCRPRLKLGKICEQITGEGTIEMIRKNTDNEIEKFDIEGGRLISDDGSWAYQIPMNLDYLITDEFGDLVPSEDPNKGIPTRASVRFKISLDETGGLGRLRTRAKYLVPNNPNNVGEVDYEFGTLTKDTSFRDLYWNKIYSVSNFVNRLQRPALLGGVVKNRNMCALKDVDDCPGDKNPVPFNRVNVVFNPLFFIICLIMKIIELILAIVNATVILIINILIGIWNWIWNKLCGVKLRIPRIITLRPFKFACNLILNYVSCIYGTCPFDDGYIFAPWCFSKKGKEAIGSPVKSIELWELSNCVSAEMARALNLFQFDFYNDWLNGSLYAFLVKYKKRRNTHKFCNQDCSGGRCKTTLMVDTCFTDASSSAIASTSEGMIKRYNGELYYAATTKDVQYKLYATELVNFGAVFNCDWQGVPNIHSFLRPTTYMSPPLIDEYDATNLNTLETSGQVDIDKGSDWNGVFFSISCVGLSCNERQCLNIRHNSEFGVDFDQRDEDVNGTPVVLPNHNLGRDEIDGEYGRYVRDALFALNNVPNSITFNPPYTTDFNIGNQGVYNFASPTQNGQNYIDFRGITGGVNNAFRQPTHSYFHYFGVMPGKTGLDKMNAKFFTQCFNKLDTEFLIKINSTTGVTSTNLTAGGVSFTIVAGTGPFDYIISGPGGVNITGQVPTTNPSATVNGLAQGYYTITVTDANGNPVTQSFEINAPVPLYADAAVTRDTTGTTANGEITLIAAGGGSGSYTFVLYNHTGVQVVGATINGSSATFPAAITSTPLVIGNLAIDNASDGATPEHFGYYIVVTDSAGATVNIWNLAVNGTLPLSVTTTINHITCYNSITGGTVNVSITGGNSPYQVQGTRVPLANGDDSWVGFNAESLVEGNYTIAVQDASQPPLTTNLTTYIGHLSPEMKISVDRIELAKQCDPLMYHVKFTINNGGAATVGPNAGKTYIDLVNTTYGNKVYYQWAKDEGIDTEDPTTTGYWSAPIAITVPAGLNSSTIVEATFPNNLVFGALAIRICDPVGNCSSDATEDETEFLIDEMALAPLLEINIGPTVAFPAPVSPVVDNTQQCTPNTVTFKFNVSHLLLNATYRKPYTVIYRIKPKTLSVAGPWSNLVTLPNHLNNSQQPITSPVPSQFTIGTSTFNTSYCDIEVYIIDDVGCQSNTLLISNIQLPTSAVGGQFQSTCLNPPGCTNCKKYLVPSGGIAPYSLVSGYAIYDGNINGPTAYAVPCNFMMLSTIKDSVGCVAVINNV